MRTALFWGITQRVAIKFLTDVLGQLIVPIFRVKESKSKPVAPIRILYRTDCGRSLGELMITFTELHRK